MRDSADSADSGYGVTRRKNGKKRGKFLDAESAYAKRDRHLPRLEAEGANDQTDGLQEGDRWSTWDQSMPTERGPKPHPKWLVTDLAAVDYELGVLKTGKEADVFLVRRGVPGTDRSCLLAAKRYRDATHRQFQRDAGRKRRLCRSREAACEKPGGALTGRYPHGAAQHRRGRRAPLQRQHRILDALGRRYQLLAGGVEAQPLG